MKYKLYKKRPILVRGTGSKLHFVAKIKKKKKARFRELEFSQGSICESKPSFGNPSLAK